MGRLVEMGRTANDILTGTPERSFIFWGVWAIVWLLMHAFVVPLEGGIHHVIVVVVWFGQIGMSLSALAAATKQRQEREQDVA